MPKTGLYAFIFNTSRVVEQTLVSNLIRQETSGFSSIAFSYSHNKNGYITGEVREENGETTESQYGYDALGQLVSFRQSTGYGEQYIYDAAGNMTKKVISPEQTAGQKKNQPVTIKMKYNPGNQLTEMAVGKDKISYSYDPNGSMIQKVLNSQNFGTLTDEYTYDVLDQFTGYYGYDGYVQILAYDANGMRLSKQEKGNTNRSTLEELLRGNIPGLPEIIEPTGETVEDGYEWATTEYLYDITQEYYQVIQETTTSRTENSTAAYSYGLERIAAHSDDDRTNYIYDGRGSVVQSVTAHMAGTGLDSQINPSQGMSNSSYRYTPFGEQQNTKTSGFTYNAEAYDVAMGMLDLRARQYEPLINQFHSKDKLKGKIINPLSLNKYGYCFSCPLTYQDPSGLSIMGVGRPKNIEQTYVNNGNINSFNNGRRQKGDLSVTKQSQKNKTQQKRTVTTKHDFIERVNQHVLDTDGTNTVITVKKFISGLDSQIRENLTHEQRPCSSFINQAMPNGMSGGGMTTMFSTYAVVAAKIEDIGGYDSLIKGMVLGEMPSLKNKDVSFDVDNLPAESIKHGGVFVGTEIKNGTKYYLIDQSTSSRGPTTTSYTKEQMIENGWNICMWHKSVTVDPEDRPIVDDTADGWLVIDEENEGD